MVRRALLDPGPRAAERITSYVWYSTVPVFQRKSNKPIQYWAWIPIIVIIMIMIIMIIIIIIITIIIIDDIIIVSK